MKRFTIYTYEFKPIQEPDLNLFEEEVKWEESIANKQRILVVSLNLVRF